MRIGLIIAGIFLLLVSAGMIIFGLTTLSLTGGHIVSTTGNNTFIGGFTNMISIYGYAETAFGGLFLLLGSYLIVTGLRTEDKDMGWKKARSQPHVQSKKPHAVKGKTYKKSGNKPVKRKKVK